MPTQSLLKTARHAGGDRHLKFYGDWDNLAVGSLRVKRALN
jgi:hypothetical protein